MPYIVKTNDELLRTRCAGCLVSNISLGKIMNIKKNIKSTKTPPDQPPAATRPDGAPDTPAAPPPPKLPQAL
jgi:hypothetical protein